MNGWPNGRVKPAGFTWPLDTELVRDDETDPELHIGGSCALTPCEPPTGGRAWTRTRDLGLIRAAL
jgi:hypothetical protein